ncbi:MAG: hypothetical protein WC734_06180 [Patescibacteria group bacterium]|jgi:predicted GIY-YIG superfamily endonuclease
MVYFLRLSQPLGNRWHTARWYVGYTFDDRTLQQRILAHTSGTAAAFTRAAVLRGIKIEFMGVIDGGRETERAIKFRKNHAREYERLNKRGLIQPKSWLRTYANTRFEGEPIAGSLCQ